MVGRRARNDDGKEKAWNHPSTYTASFVFYYWRQSNNNKIGFPNFTVSISNHTGPASRFSSQSVQHLETSMIDITLFSLTLLCCVSDFFYKLLSLRRDPVVIGRLAADSTKLLCSSTLRATTSFPASFKK